MRKPEKERLLLGSKPRCKDDDDGVPCCGLNAAGLGQCKVRR
jgi:hypothetical protein